MKHAAERVAKRRCFGRGCFRKHKRMKHAAENVAKRRGCFRKHKRMKHAAENVDKRRAASGSIRGRSMQLRGLRKEGVLQEAQEDDACS